MKESDSIIHDIHDKPNSGNEKKTNNEKSGVL